MTQTTDAALVGRLRAVSRQMREHNPGRGGFNPVMPHEHTLDQAADTIEAQARRIEALEVSLVAHNCGRPECVCVECCRKHPTPCDMHSDFSKWCGHCLEVNGFTSPDEAP